MSVRVRSICAQKFAEFGRDDPLLVEPPQILSASGGGWEFGGQRLKAVRLPSFDQLAMVKPRLLDVVGERSKELIRDLLIDEKLWQSLLVGSKEGSNLFIVVFEIPEGLDQLDQPLLHRLLIGCECLLALRLIDVLPQSRTENMPSTSFDKVVRRIADHVANQSFNHARSILFSLGADPAERARGINQR
jgi:hypothetical protein